MKAINLRVREETLDLADALMRQRGQDRADVLRAAFDVGMLLIAASGPPAEDGTADTYGTLPGSRLAQRLRPRIAPVLDFLSRYDAAPRLVAHAEPPTPATSPPPQATSRCNGTFAVDDTVGGTLDAFGARALGDA